MANTEEEESFSIREYARRMRVANPDKCWPFDGIPVGVALLPPMTVRKFRWWADELEEADKSVVGEPEGGSGGGDPVVPEKKKKSGRKPKKTVSFQREPVAWEGIIKAFTEVCGRTLEDMGPKKGSRRIWIKLWTHLQNSFQQNRNRPLAINDRGMPGSVSFSGRRSQDAGGQQSFEVGESSDQSLNPRVERESLNEDAPADDKTMSTTRFRGHGAIKKRKFL